MIQVQEELKTLYRKDNIYKKLIVVFPELGMEISKKQIVSESFSLTESLCSESDLTFGGCESAEVKITVADITEDLTGKLMVITQVVDETYTMPLGTYVVDSAKKTDDMRFKDIIAYDHMLKLDVDVSAWYNHFFSGTGSKTLKMFRDSLFSFVGLQTVPQELANDAMTLSKTIEPTYLSGRDVARSIGEINGVFGHMTRENKFKYIDLSSLGLYPSETLYPAEDLFPAEAVDNLGTASYISGRREEYFVKPIDCLQIRQEEGDVGFTHGDGDNLYIIQGNFLVYGKTAAELKTIAYNIFMKVRNKYYLPHTTTTIGLPYLEVGDSVNIFTRNDVIETFIFKRVLSGIQALRDEYSATGSEYRNNTVSPATNILQLQAKTLRIDKSVDQVSVKLEDTKEDLESQITQTAKEINLEVKNTKESLESQIVQTAKQISLEVKDTKEGLESQITQLAGEIILKVDGNGKVVSVALGVDPSKGSSLKIRADNIDLQGYVTISDLSGSGTTEINGDNIRSGTISGVRFETIPASGSDGTIISNGLISTSSIFIMKRLGLGIIPVPLGYFYYSAEQGKVILGASEVSCSTINGTSPLLNCNNSGSENTVISISKSENDVVVHKGFRCTFSGTSESSTPNARVSGGGNVAQAASSSIRYKKDIKPVEDEDLNIKNLYKINVKQFKYREGYLKEGDRRNGKNIVGFIVEQLDRYYPIAVDYNDEGFPEMWNSNIMIPAMFGLIKEQKEEITELRNELAELKELLKTKGVI